jgi:uncharacterized SAM-binding protein YcdF (DUF218 family)
VTRYRVILGIAAAVVVLLVAVAMTGSLLFADSRVDPLRRADAVIVRGGEHDGREEYGLRLVREGYASVLVLSDPYDSSDPVMKRLCDPGHTGVEVVCRAPHPSTTRGEAILAHQLAAERNWRTVIVVSWRYHLPRARLIFSQCFSSAPDSVIMRDVPRRYPYAVVQWEYTFMYQYAAFAKAFAQGDCG